MSGGTQEAMLGFTPLTSSWNSAPTAVWADLYGSIVGKSCTDRFLKEKAIPRVTRSRADRSVGLELFCLDVPSTVCW